MSVSEEKSESEDIDHNAVLESDRELSLQQVSPVPTADMLPPPAEDKNATVDKAVVWFAALIVGAVVVWALAFPDNFENFSAAALDFVVTDFGWVYIVAGSVFVFFILWVALSKYGRIRLGQDDERPEFNAASWIAMLFAAGMGIGLMFYGVAEPLTFFQNGVPGEASESVPVSMATALFHWTLHPWAIYAIVGLAIAYGTFRLGRKQLFSSAFIPLIGVRRAEGWLGKLIDVLSIFATVFGTAASLGLGTLQIAAGMNATDIVHDPGTGWLLVIIGVLGLAYLVSAFSGVSKGVQWLSNFNMVFAAILAFFVLVVGPTVVIANTIPTAFGNYLQEFFGMAARTADSAPGMDEWLAGNTLFYWAWWISWSPFVGTFIARISRGRTVREFILVIMLVPTAVSVVWFSIFGGSAIHKQSEGTDVFGEGDAESMLFNVLNELPLGGMTSIIAMVLLATFFITSGDSASTVMGTMSQNGKLVADRKLTVLWGLFTALIAVVLLVTGGADALNSLQAVTIIAASPFVILLLFLCLAIQRGLAQDPLFLDEKQRRAFALRLARERRFQESSKRSASRRNHPGDNADTKDTEKSVNS